MKRYRRFYLLLLFVSIFSLTGCWGSREVDEAAYVVAMGLDNGTNEDLILSMAVADVLPAGGTTEGPRMKIRVVSARAPSFFSALTWGNTILERPPNLTHLKLLVFGQDLAGQGIGRHLDVLVRWREFRRTVYLAVAEGKAADVLAALAKIKEEDVAKYLELMLINQGITGVIPASSQFLRFYNDIRSKGETPLAAMALLRQERGPLPPSPTPGEKATAKRPSVAGEGPLCFAGTAVFKEGRMVGRLNPEETVAASFMRGDLQQAFINLPFPQDAPHEMELRVMPAGKPRLYVARAKKGVCLRLTLFLRGEVVNIERAPGARAPLSLSAAEKALKDWMERRCREVLAKAQAWRADFFGFARKARWLVPDWPAWRRWDWEAAFAAAPVSLEVRARLDRTGLTLEGNNVREE
ncbi:MAG: Ger(x)C family spore germination protein [Bacillota bacterium]